MNAPVSPTPTAGAQHGAPCRRRREEGAAGLIVLILLVVAAAGVALALRLQAGDEGDASRWSLTPPLEPGLLRLALVEKGSLEAVDPVLITNQVEGRSTILKIVDEGSVVTEEDVAAGLVLVQLDTSELEEQVRRQDIEVKSAEAGLENARSNLEIQRRQNESDIRKAELSVRFARLDLERYVGSHLAGQLAALTSREGTSEGGAAPTVSDLIEVIGTMLADDRLDGEARQRIRELESEAHLAEEERRRADDKLTHSVRLEEKGFISREELDLDRLGLQRREIDVERAKIARQQFALYDFPKEVQRLLSDVLEAHDELARERDKARAAERRAEADLSSKEEQATMQAERLRHLRKQITLCTIRAPVPGMVVYASSGNERRWGDEDRIREGSTVRERQVLLRVPNPEHMAATVDIHESVVRRVTPGMKAWVTVDAEGAARLEARVKEVARMPNASDRWWNPDRKVYPTTLELVGRHPGFKPGMTCSVEILTGEVHDALSVPVQAIVGRVDDPAVWKDDGRGGIVRTKVTLGPANDLRVVIASGLSAGDRVVLNPPPEPRSGRGVEDGAREKTAREKPGATADADAQGGAAQPAAADGTAAPSAPGGGAPRPTGGRGRGGR